MAAAQPTELSCYLGAYNAIDRGMLGRLPNLPSPITTAWAASGFRVFYTTPRDG